NDLGLKFHVKSANPFCQNTVIADAKSRGARCSLSFDAVTGRKRMLPKGLSADNDTAADKQSIGFIVAGSNQRTNKIILESPLLITVHPRVVGSFVFNRATGSDSAALFRIIDQYIAACPLNLIFNNIIAGSANNTNFNSLLAGAINDKAVVTVKAIQADFTGFISLKCALIAQLFIPRFIPTIH